MGPEHGLSRDPGKSLPGRVSLITGTTRQSLPGSFKQGAEYGLTNHTWHKTLMLIRSFRLRPGSLNRDFGSEQETCQSGKKAAIQEALQSILGGLLQGTE